jgi:hypothetical protein
MASRFRGGLGHHGEHAAREFHASDDRFSDTASAAHAFLTTCTWRVARKRARARGESGESEKIKGVGVARTGKKIKIDENRGRCSSRTFRCRISPLG